VGSHGPVGPDRGDSAPLVADGETIGMALRTRSGVKPVFVSVGHMVDLPSACDLVLRATGRYRIPEPIRLAHGLTQTLMRERDRAPAGPVRRTYPDFVRTRAT
jgi:deoxyribonuclease V